MTRRQMRLYIDTYGHNRGIWRNAGDQARIAAHLPNGDTMEFVVQANGSWAVNEGNVQVGGYRQIARCAAGGKPIAIHHPDDGRKATA